MFSDSIAGWDFRNEDTLFRQLDENYGMEDNPWIDLIGIILNWMRIVSYNFSRVRSIEE